MGVAIGVDSHKSSLAVGIVDEMSRTVSVREFTNDGAGRDSLIDWVDDHGPERVIGIEGSGSYGAALARRLLQAGDDVREVPAFMSHRERKKNPSRGKSDVNDAIAIAQVVARGEGLSSPQREVIYEDLKLLSDHRDRWFVLGRKLSTAPTRTWWFRIPAMRSVSQSSSPRRT